jgi:hypothetical protein
MGMTRGRWWALLGSVTGALAVALVMVQGLDQTLSEKEVPRVVRLGQIQQSGDSTFGLTCPEGKGFALLWGCPRLAVMDGASISVSLSAASGVKDRQVVTAASLCESNWLDDQGLIGYIINGGSRLDAVMRPGVPYTVVVTAEEEVPHGTSLWVGYLGKAVSSE